MRIVRGVLTVSFKGLFQTPVHVQRFDLITDGQILPNPFNFHMAKNLSGPSSVNQGVRRIIANEAINPYVLGMAELPLFSVGPGSAL